jgi:putative endopeptidase
MQTKILVFAFILSVSMMFSFNQQLNAQTANKPQVLSKSNMDLNVKPGDDFFLYANGTWLKNHPIPDDKIAYGSGEELDDFNQFALKDIIEVAVKNTTAPKGSSTQKIRDFYLSGMDTLAIDKAGVTPLKKEFDLINNIKTIKDVEKVSAYYASFGSNPFFTLFASSDPKNSDMVIAQIWEGGMNLPDRDYYVNEDETTIDIQKEYKKFISKIFVLSGVKEADAVKNAEIIFNIEKKFALVANTRLENRDPNKRYNKMSITELEKLCPNYDWKMFFTTLKHPEISEINVCQPKFIEGFNTILKETNINDWKILLKWNLINGFAPYLTKDFVNARFDFYGTFLYGQKTMRPRWKRVLSETDGALGELVGQLFVEKYFPPAAKKRMTELVLNLKKALKGRIENLVWMSSATKVEALEKLDAMNLKIGYPDIWKDYSGITITKGSYLNNVLEAGKFNTAFDLNKIGKPVDKNEWEMTPQTVNAYYAPNKNEIVFPAGILQPPFFDMNADDAANYGAIGAIIGHEMTHGFDDQGRQYDKKGNLRDWWTKSDADEFNKRTEVLVQQFNNIVAIDTVKLNGKLTLGENIADLGGLTISYNAFLMTDEAKNKDLKIEGFTPSQRFFLSYAQVWKKNIRDKALLRLIKEDVHSPAKYRVIGIVYNMPEFYNAFPEITSADKLFKDINSRAKIW